MSAGSRSFPTPSPTRSPPAKWPNGPRPIGELAENALDAGARHVRVELEHGGKTLIQVSDDGSGMGREDAVLAIDRHATSKVRSAADLVGVATFGFRGEALPAIASVSRFSLTTHDGEGAGTELTVTGGRLDRVADTVRQRGTTVAVRSVFFNTPARRKFLRSVSSETRAAHEAVATLALAHPEAGFELHVDGTCRLAVPADQSAEERIATVWGRELAATLVPVAYAAGAFRITGLVQRPGDAQPTGRRTQLFVNGRPFRDPFLVRAGEAGYRSAIHPGDRPSMLLRIEVSPGEVDVNVHPAKLEVRFRDRIGVERAVEEAVRSALGTLAAAVNVGRAGGPWDGGAVAVELPPMVAGDLFAPHGPSGEDEAPVESGTLGFTVPLLQAFDTYILYEAPEGSSSWTSTRPTSGSSTRR
jgi:DNA mismatch repair protein MutL